MIHSQCLNSNNIQQPETSNQLKFNFFPGIWGDYEKDFLWDTVQHPFPNGRRRREIKTDSLTGQTYESYDGDVVQTGDVPLRNETVSNVDDEFDDQFEEDIEEQKRIEEFFRQHENGVEDDTDKTDDPDLSSSRWIAYDALAQMLQR